MMTFAALNLGILNLSPRDHFYVIFAVVH